jgi:predicted HTH transcriptional regulator
MAAILLFGRDPQRFVPAGEVRCMHFHGTAVERPAPSYQVFKGNLFEQVDRGADFVLSVLNRRVGTRALSAQASVSYEIPPDVVREAIVNAVAHRDYASGAAVQVLVFSDRVEVWNPGTLPGAISGTFGTSGPTDPPDAASKRSAMLWDIYGTNGTWGRRRPAGTPARKGPERGQRHHDP